MTNNTVDFLMLFVVLAIVGIGWALPSRVSEVDYIIGKCQTEGAFQYNALTYKCVIDISKIAQ